MEDEQKPAEWSEEDDVMLDKVCCLINPGTKLTDDNVDYCVELKLWIISLQERILKSLRPQPNTVSVENATKFGNLEYERGVKDGIQHSENHRWKPSEEQLKALHTLNCFGELTYDGQLSELASLYDDIKKL